MGNKICVLLTSALLLVPGAAARAQTASPGTSTATNVTLGAGAATIGSIGNTAFGLSGPIPAGANTIGGVNANALAATTTNGSTTVATGGTFQTALASSATRKGCLIQNPFTATETLFVYFGSGTASTANSIGLAPGGVATCSVSGSYVATDAVQITGATTGHAFVLNSQ